MIKRKITRRLEQMYVVVRFLLCGTLFAAWAANAGPLFDPADKSRPRAATSVPQSEDPKSEWRVRHDAKVKAIAASDAPIMFFGDSIVACWAGAGLGVWNRHFAEGEFKAVNYGSGGDRTQNAIWRVYHGPFATYKPKAIVLMIGTNNAGFSPYAEETTTDTAIGFKTLIDAIRASTPKSKIILCAIPPRGAKADDPVRLRNEKVNREIKKLADDRKVFWLDFGDQLTEPDGTISKAMMPDYLHPAEAGYRIWAKALLPALRRALAVPNGPSTCVPVGRTGEEWWLYWMRQKRGEIATFRGKTVDAVLLGDSITDFYNTRSFLSDLRVYNRGFSGNRSDQLVDALPHTLGLLHPEKIVILIGANDIGHGFDNAHVLKNLQITYDYIQKRAPGVPVILVSVMPSNPADKADMPNHYEFTSVRPNEKILALNAELRPFAEAHGWTYLDANPHMQDERGYLREEYTLEGLHFVDPGYEQYTKLLRPLLEQK